MVAPINVLAITRLGVSVRPLQAPSFPFVVISAVLYTCTIGVRRRQQLTGVGNTYLGLATDSHTQNTGLLIVDHTDDNAQHLVS